MTLPYLWMCDCEGLADPTFSVDVCDCEGLADPTFSLSLRDWLNSRRTLPSLWLCVTRSDWLGWPYLLCGCMQVGGTGWPYLLCGCEWERLADPTFSVNVSEWEGLADPTFSVDVCECEGLADPTFSVDVCEWEELAEQQEDITFSVDVCWLWGTGWPYLLCGCVWVGGTGWAAGGHYLLCGCVWLGSTRLGNRLHTGTANQVNCVSGVLNFVIVLEHIMKHIIYYAQWVRSIKQNWAEREGVGGGGGGGDHTIMRNLISKWVTVYMVFLLYDSCS